MFWPILIPPPLWAASFKQPTENKTMLYEVAIIKKSTPKQIENGEPKETILLEPKAVVADNEKAAIVKATQGITDDLSNAEILVRPFA